VRILVVEDEAKVASFIKKGLTEESYSVDVASTGPDGEYLAQINFYELVVLDLMLPGKDGIEVCRSLRAGGFKAPILMLTAKSTLQDKITGLDSGADDYLVKPFAFEELLARIRALLRRGHVEGAAPLRVDNLQLDRVARRARRGGRDIPLTSREYALLEYFMRHVGQVLTRAMIAENVWGLDFDSESNVIEVTLSHLRGKVDQGERPLIQTLRGFGYVMRAEDGS